MMEENKVTSENWMLKDTRFPSPPYYVSAECKLIPKAVDEELTRLDTESSRLASRVQELEQEIADRDAIIIGFKEVIDGNTRPFSEIKKELDASNRSGQNKRTQRSGATSKAAVFRNLQSRINALKAHTNDRSLQDSIKQVAEICKRHAENAERALARKKEK